MDHNQTLRKPWHGLNEPTIVGAPVETSGRQIKNPAVIRKLAIAAGELARDKAKAGNLSAGATFQCPACNQWFLYDYGRLARIQWPDEWTHHCGNCIDEFRLEIESRGTTKKQSTDVYLEKMLGLGYTMEQLVRAGILKTKKPSK